MDSDQGKLFIGGISWETSEDNLKEYFGNYGDVLQSVVMRDKITGKPRGFAFVSFADPSIIDRVLQDTHTINGRTVEAKRALSREEQQTSTRTGNPMPVRNSGNSGAVRTKKIFVGGLPASLSEEGFRQYFEAYGHVTDVVVMYDQATQRPRGFGFISFDCEDAVDRVLHKTFHDLNGKQVEVKRALPKDANPGGAGRSMGSGGGGGSNYGGNPVGYDSRSDSNRYMQPPSSGAGFPGYGSSGYPPPGFGYGPANNGMGYGGYGGYGAGGPAAAYGNPSVPSGGYPGGQQSMARNSWSSQAPPSGYGTMGYGNAAPWGGASGGPGPGNSGPSPTGQSPSGAAGYGNQVYGYGGYGGGDSSYANQSGYGNVGGRAGGASESNANVPAAAGGGGGGGMGDFQGSGGGYMGGGYVNNANGAVGYGNAAWRPDPPPQGSGNYANGQTGYGAGYGGAQGR